MIDFIAIRKSIKQARAPFIKQAEEAAEKIIRDTFGTGFAKIEGGFVLDGITIKYSSDQYNNFFLKELSGLPALDRLEKFVEAILYFCESVGSDLAKSLYAMRSVCHFLFDLYQRFPQQIDKAYADEMLRIGDMYCEKNSGFRRWAFGTYSGVGHYGSDAKC